MISQIFHLADIHIRKGNYTESRFTEYWKVFETTINDIKSLHTPNQSITVICGDLFHHKLQISSNGILLFYKLIYSLADMMPVFIIQGNHDLIQENDDKNNDLIKALLHSKHHDNVHYIENTTSFEFDSNLYFGVVSIRDMLQRGAGSGMVDTLPEFPKPSPDRLNIAISHTTVMNCTLHNYTKATSGVPVEWFKDYDLVLLGDVHLQSAKYSKKHNLYYGYPGSLVQQDFGESIYNHGFLLWNINKNNKIKLERYHVMNDFARANMRIGEKDNLYITGDNYEPFDMFLERELLPKELHIRLYCKESTDTSSVRLKVEKRLMDNGIESRIDLFTTGMTELKENNKETLMESSLKDLTCSDTIIEFFKSNGNQTILESNPDWQNLFKNIESIKITPNSLLPEQINALITTKNDKIDKKIESTKSNNTTSKSQNSLRIVSVRFDWILAFGTNNVFKFSNNKITLINAPNGYGKSAFFECIVLGLFGETIPSRYNRNTALSILNKRKPPNTDSSSVRISFVLNNNEYTVIREFHEYSDSRNKSVKRLGSNKIELYENKILIKTGNRVVNSWISDNVCSLQDFLLSTMITQNFDNDFFKLKPNEQNELLDSVLNMKVVNATCNVINDTRKEYRDLKNHLTTFLDAKKPNTVFDNDKYQQLIIKRSKIKEDLVEHQNLYNSLPVFPSKRIETVDKPLETVDELLEMERELIRELNVLGVSIKDKVNMFELYDLSASQFEVETEDTNTKLADKDKVKQLVSLYKDENIKELIVKFREATDKYEYAKYNLNNIISNKPQQTTQYTIDDYNTFQQEYKLFKKKTAKIVIVEKPDFDELEEPEFINDYKDMTEKELIKLSKQSYKNTSIPNNFVNNPECWACTQNFGSNKPYQAKVVLNYRDNLDKLEKWRIYEKKKPLVEKMEELEGEKKSWEDTQLLIEKNEDYNEQYEKHNRIVDEKRMERINIGKSIVEIMDYQSKCNKGHNTLKQLHITQTKLKYYKNLKLKSKTLTEHLNNDLINLQHKIGCLESTKLQEDEYNDVSMRMEDTIEMLERRIPLFAHFVDTFSKYKTWIYNEKVLPVIVNKTNSILNTLFSNRQLVLGFDLTDGTDIMFTVKDEGNVVNMEKLSGAQSFAVSLSFRLALSAVGISRFRCNQLFIDEGFCSFDQYNLLNVPILIKNLKQIYQEIVLVTHLEEIKSCADTVVNIERINGISKILHN